MPIRKSTIAAGQLFQRSLVSPRTKPGGDVFLTVFMSPVGDVCIWLEPEEVALSEWPLRPGVSAHYGRYGPFHLARRPCGGATQTRRRCQPARRVIVSGADYLIRPESCRSFSWKLA